MWTNILKVMMVLYFLISLIAVVGFVAIGIYNDPDYLLQYILVAVGAFIVLLMLGAVMGTFSDIASNVQKMRKDIAEIKYKYMSTPNSYPVNNVAASNQSAYMQYSEPQYVNNENNAPQYENNGSTPAQ